MSKSLIEKLIEYRNDGEGLVFNADYDVKNQLFFKILIAKNNEFYVKYVTLFENDCKKFRERLGESWYKNDLARYMLYRKYNIKELRTKCDNFPNGECDSSNYVQKFIYKLYDAKERLKNEPWLAIERNGKKFFFGDTLTPPWTILRALIEYCYMVDHNEIFEEDSYEDLAGHKIFNFKVPDDEIEIINETILNDIGTTNYEVALCEYIMENIVSIIEMFERHLGDIVPLKNFIGEAHNGSGSNYLTVPRELLNRSRDPYINRKIAPGVELPNAGRVWDISDIPLLFILRWYVMNYGKEVSINHYIENQDLELKYLAKPKNENKELKNLKLWLNYYNKSGGYDAFIEAYNLQDFVYGKDSEENRLLEALANCDKNYSNKYGFPKELFKGHLYKYDFTNGIERAKPYDIYKANSVEEDFPFPGYVNGIDDFKQIFENFKYFSDKRKERLLS